MADDSGWKPLQPSRRAGGESLVATPFTHLARVHAASVAGDAMVAMALAGSLFFSIDPTDARWRVALYLGLTMAPFALVSPLIGPALDRARGGRRLVVVGVNAGRALVCLMMIDDLDGLLLFPQAFAVLVMGKGYAVARSALVPTVVAHDSDLVRANSKLSLLSGVMALAAAVPAGIAHLIAGPEGILVVATVVFVVGAALGMRLPKAQIAASPASAAEKAELRGAGILLAVSAMAVMRGIVGFLTMLLAFELRTEGAPTWHFGVVLALTAVGGPAGAVIAPVLRRTLPEERALQLSLAVACAGAVLFALLGGLWGAALVAAVVALTSTVGKLAVDSLVQRDAPDANRGRSFARFETRFQLVWVAGAIVPVVVSMPAPIGYLLVAGAAGFALFSYVAGTKAIRTEGRLPRRRRLPLRGGRPGRTEPDEPDDPGEDHTVVIDPTKLQ